MRMKQLISRSIVLTGIAIGAWGALWSDSTSHAQEPTTSPSTTQPASGSGKKRELAPFKRPGRSGAAQGAISGGSRGQDDPAIPIPFAPEKEPGLTATERPIIMFFVPKPAKGPVFFTIIDAGKSKTKLLEITLEEGFPTAGVKRIELSKHNATLRPGIVYQWNVTIASKPGGGGANDGFAAGHIMFDETKTPIREQWQSKPADERAVAYAEAGLWYDMLAAIADAMEQDPKNAMLADQRNMWLSSENISTADIGASSPEKKS
jgi:hypothetical protein